jgi:D-amino-acid dehydrogenase
MKVAVVGGGVICLACAWYLQEGGAEVVVLERDGAGMAASRGNAGWITPGLSNPLPAPGVTLRRCAGCSAPTAPSSCGPVGLGLRRLVVALLAKLQPGTYLAGMQAMLALNERTLELYDRLVADGVEFEMHKNGLLFLFLDPRAAERRRRCSRIFGGTDIPADGTPPTLSRHRTSIRRSVTACRAHSSLLPSGMCARSR